MRVTAGFALKDLNGGKTIYQGRTFSNVSYDDVGQSFADLQARTNAMERGAHEVALDIRTRLAAHFASLRNSTDGHALNGPASTAFCAVTPTRPLQS